MKPPAPRVDPGPTPSRGAPRRGVDGHAGYRSRRAPVTRAIALTGYGMDADVAASRAAGFAAHLTTPVDVQALHAAIARVTGARRDLYPA